MNKGYIRLHWITILKSIRSYWFVLASPILRSALQYVITGDAESVLLSEVLVFGAVIMYAVLKWFNTKIYIKSDNIIVKSGVFIKSCCKISTSRLSSVYIKRNLFDFVLNSAVCYLNIESVASNKKAFKVNYRDIKDVIKVNDCNISVLKTKANKKRFFLIPTVVFCVFITILLIKVLVSGRVNYYDGAIIVAIGAVCLYYVYICRYNYLHSKIETGNNIYFHGTAGLSITSYCCPKNAIGVIKIYQTPTDRRYKTCKIRFIECGAAARGVKINNADVYKVINSVNSNFDLELQV